jgi:hypothetical protein
MDMHYPREFNATHHWTYKMVLTRAKLHFTMLEQAVLTDVMADFGNDLGCEVPLAHFVPTHYTLEIRSEDGLTLGKCCVVVVAVVSVVAVVAVPVLRVCAFVACIRCVCRCVCRCVWWRIPLLLCPCFMCPTLLYVPHFSMCHIFPLFCVHSLRVVAHSSPSLHTFICVTLLCVALLYMY